MLRHVNLDLDALERIAVETGFSGAVRVGRGEQIAVERAYGLSDRAHRIPNAVETRFAIASGSKSFTALAVVALIEDRTLAWDTTARSVLGSDLPLIDDTITMEQLLAHRSGIGDYLDEEIERPITEEVLSVPAQRLATTEDFLAVLDGRRDLEDLLVQRALLRRE